MNDKFEMLVGLGQAMDPTLDGVATQVELLRRGEEARRNGSRQRVVDWPRS